MPLLVGTLINPSVKAAYLPHDSVTAVKQGVDMLQHYGLFELFRNPPIAMEEIDSTANRLDAPMVPTVKRVCEMSFAVHIPLILNDVMRGYPLLAGKRCMSLIQANADPLDNAEIVVLTAIVVEAYSRYRNELLTHGTATELSAIERIDEMLMDYVVSILEYCRTSVTSPELKNMASPALLREITDDAESEKQQLELLRMALRLNPRSQLGWLCFAWILDTVPKKSGLAVESCVLVSGNYDSTRNRIFV